MIEIVFAVEAPTGGLDGMIEKRGSCLPLVPSCRLCCCAAAAVAAAACAPRRREGGVIDSTPGSHLHIPTQLPLPPLLLSLLLPPAGEVVGQASLIPEWEYEDGTKGGVAYAGEEGAAAAVAAAPASSSGPPSPEELAAAEAAVAEQAAVVRWGLEGGCVGAGLPALPAIRRRRSPVLHATPHGPTAPPKSHPPGPAVLP